MIKKIITITCGLLLLFTGSMQAQDDFDPTLPAEPNTPVTPTPPAAKYALTVACEPSAAGRAAGAGSYEEGTSVTVSTSANAEYTFSHWTLNGERYDAATGTSFTYKTVAGDMKFVAVYNYTPTPFEPSNPSEPYAEVKSRLYLKSQPEGVCTFNRTSGAKWVVDSYVTVSVTNVNQQYEFVGWYEEGGLEPLTTERSFSHQITYNDKTLVAHFNRLPDPEPEPEEPEEPFEPENPDEPNQDGDKYTEEDVVQTHAVGDVDKNGEVNVVDLTKVLRFILYPETETGNKKLADVDSNGEINVVDITKIVRIILGLEE